MTTYQPPLKILQSVFGYSTFRSFQLEIIESLLKGNDALVIMPTGGGKSVCYQIPALILPNLTLVVSPLIALMKDQVAALKNLHVAAEFYNSSMSSSERNSVLRRARQGELKLLYIAPESLFSPVFKSVLDDTKISLFAIDEAHCISIWGNDFRPEYIRLGKLKENFRSIPIVALTATADKATQEDILKQLGITTAKTYIESFERTNITITCQPGLKRYEEILSFLRRYKDESGIIYCLSRKSTETLAGKLQQDGYSALAYHAGLSSPERHEVQRKFQHDETNIICATIAFGMGIDKSNVRYVIHFNMPKNIESYYQEMGRAGRDGLPSESLLFYSWADSARLKSFIEESEANVEFKNVQLAKLQRIWQFATASSCRTNLILNYFGEYRTANCGHCDICLHPPSVIDGTVLSQKAMSAIARINEKAGMNLLIDILRGSYRQEIKAANFHLIKTFGAGRDIPFAEWRDYITQMINQGLISIDYTDQSRLKLTPLSSDVLKGRHSVSLVKYQKVKDPVKPRSKAERMADELFDRLREWRKRIAQEKGIPAYHIFSDGSLRQMADNQPVNLDALLQIEGVGEVKLKEYGTTILKVIRKYVREQPHKKNVKGMTYLQTLYLYNQGMAPDEIATMRNVHTLTILGHLATLYEWGEDIDPELIVSTAERDIILSAYEKSGRPSSPKAVYDALRGRYEYFKIKTAMNYFSRELKKEKNKS